MGGFTDKKGMMSGTFDGRVGEEVSAIVRMGEVARYVIGWIWVVLLCVMVCFECMVCGVSARGLNCAWRRL